MDLILVYYRRKDTGEITRHHAAPKGWTPEDLKKGVDHYNSEKSHETTACIATVEAGSFDAYLLDRLEKKYRLAKQAIQEAIDAIDDARSCINSLEVEQ